MEVRLDPGDGELPRQDTFVSLRIGDVQKQARFGAARTYRFPDPGEGRRTFGRVEVFKRVGHVTVSFDSEDGEFQDFEVPCHPGSDALRLKVAVACAKSPQTVEAAEKTGRARVRMDAAARYLAEHRVEEMLAEAMREVICSKPEDPHTFLAELILKQRTTPRSLDEILKPPPALPSNSPMSPSAERASPPLDKAAPPPQAGMRAVPTSPTAAAAATAAAATPPRVQIPFALRPSVGTWRLPLPPPPEDCEGEDRPHEGPWNRRASVGTWLCPAPPEEEEEQPESPMGGSQLQGWRPEEIVNAFQSEIDRKDAEIAHLKKLLGLA